MHVLCCILLQLLHPLGEKSPIESFLKKKPAGGMHHICLEVSTHVHAWHNDDDTLTFHLYTTKSRYHSHNDLDGCIDPWPKLELSGMGRRGH